MKVVQNTNKIEKNKKIGKYTTIGGLVILGIGLYVNLTAPQEIIISFGSLILGFALSQVGIYYSNRFGRSPRPDELLTSSLKGLSEQYTLYHYMTPVPHVLVGPAGLWVLLPYPQTGVVTYLADKKRWHHKGGNFFMKIFAQEGIAKPDVEAKYMAEDLQKYLAKQMPGAEIPPVQALAVFTAKTIELNAEGAPVEAVVLDKVKDFFRKKAKPGRIDDQIAAVNAAIPEA